MRALTRDNGTRYRSVQGVPAEELTEAERDYELEDRLIFLVAQLEQLMIRLREQEAPQPAAIPRVLAEMINRTMALVETLPAADPQARALRPAIEEAGRVHPFVRLLPVENNRLMLEHLFGGGRESAGYLSTSQTLIQQVCQGMILVLRSYFIVFEKTFYLSTMQDRWRGLYQVFISDLASAVTEIQPLHSIKRTNDVRN